MTTTQEKLAEAFAPLAVAPDLPGAPQRSHFMQVPSDRLRDHAREFCRVAIGLVPDVEYHGQLIDFMHDLVVLGEQAMERVLETREDFQGYKYDLVHAPLRMLVDVNQEEASGEQASTQAEDGEPAGDSQPAA